MKKGTNRGEWMQSYHGGLWHRAMYHESRGDVTGKLHATYHTTACSGKGLYSAWGKPTVVPSMPPGKLCKRCANAHAGGK